MTPTLEIARKVLTTVDAGLCSGLGVRKPGEMCIEAAVCYAFDMPHSDQPPCVGSSVRSFKITLNDCNWSSNEARAKGMRKLAIAQLGSDSINQIEFSRLLAKKTIQKLLPKLFRQVAQVQQEPHKTKMLKAADDCESSDDSTTAAAG